MTYFLITIIFFLLLIIVFLSYKLYQFSLIIFDMEDAVEDSLDILNERYKSINKILEKEVFFDSIEVRQVINEIRISHEAILAIANLLTKNTKMIGNDASKEKSD